MIDGGISRFEKLGARNGVLRVQPNENASEIIQVFLAIIFKVNRQLWSFVFFCYAQEMSNYHFD